ncbi:MAG: hypothetical protein KDK48_06710, partial [Chlamydiia bacterium]|nr:hypothetical protein [Chlamydiia bacterium]
PKTFRERFSANLAHPYWFNRLFASTVRELNPVEEDLAKIVDEILKHPEILDQLAGGNRVYRFSAQVTLSAALSVMNAAESWLNYLNFATFTNIVRQDGLRLGKCPNGTFETAEFAHFWYNGSSLAEVELPRFKLTFKGSELQCKEIPGFKWVPNQAASELRGFEDALVLVDKKGNKKVLLPNLENTTLKSEDRDSIKPNYKLNRQSGSLPSLEVGYFVYDVDKKGHLTSTKRENNLHLAYTLAAAQNSRQSAKLLTRYANKLSAFTPAERGALTKFLSIEKTTADETADTLILQTYAGIRLLKQPTKEDAKILDETVGRYTLWLKKKGLTTCMTPAKEDEVFLLKMALAKSTDAFLFNRLEELDPQAAKDIGYEAEEPSKSHLQPAKAYARPQMGFENQEPSLVVLTRPGALFTHFAYYFELLLDGDSKESHFVESALPFLASMEGGGTLAKIYLAVLKNPSKFKNLRFSTIDYDKRDKDGWRTDAEKLNKQQFDAIEKVADMLNINIDHLYPSLKNVVPKRTSTASKESKEPTAAQPTFRAKFVGSWKKATEEVVTTRREAS